MFDSLGESFVLFDTEYTAWEGSWQRKWSGPGEEKEIVQIGGIIVQTDTLTEKDHFLRYAQPVVNPKLSDYFIKLTGISQETVDTEGSLYPDALARFKKWSRNMPLYSWGTDLEIMEENAKLIGIPFPFAITGKTDIRVLFGAHGIDTSKYDSGTIPEALGEVPLYKSHGALNDARCILQGLRALKRKLISS